jgi:WD40 repeat protein
MAESEYLFATSMTTDGEYIAVGGDRRAVYVFETETGLLKKNYTSFSGAISALAFSNDGAHLAIGLRSAPIYVRTLDGGDQILLSGHRSKITDLTFSPNADRLLSADEDGKFYSWYWLDRTIEATVELDPRGLYSLLWDKLTNRIYAGGSGKIYSLLLGAWTVQKEMQTEFMEYINGLDIIRSNNNLGSISVSEFHIWNGSTLTSENTITDEINNATDIVTLKVGTQYFWAVSRRDGMVLLYTDDGHLQYAWYTTDEHLSQNRRTVNQMASMSESNILATAGSDGHLKIWRINSQ